MTALNNVIMFLFFMFIIILCCSLGHSQLSATPLHTSILPKSPFSLDPVLPCGGHLPVPLTGFWNLEVVILIPVNNRLFGSLGIKSELLF